MKFAEGSETVTLPGSDKSSPTVYVLVSELGFSPGIVKAWQGSLSGDTYAYVEIDTGNGIVYSGKPTNPPSRLTSLQIVAGKLRFGLKDTYGGPTTITVNWKAEGL